MAGDAGPLTLGAMARDASELPTGRADELLGADGRPNPRWRRELRTIPAVRNAASVAFAWAQVAAVAVVAARWPHPATWLAAILAMGCVHARFAALMHEAAHRLLLPGTRANDAVGRWLLGYPQMTNTDAYRRVHMAHHRTEFGPDEPDLALYANYPIPPASMRRKLLRDATGRTGWRLLRDQFAPVRRRDARHRAVMARMLAVQAALLGAFFLAGEAHLYLVVWVVPHLTVWRVINRLRSIAEHGGLDAASDRRATTHSVRQDPISRFLIAPYGLGYHLAHHVDAGVPFRRLGEYHRALRESGYVSDEYEYPSYRALWTTLASEPVATR